MTLAKAREILAGMSPAFLFDKTKTAPKSGFGFR
jgi:hypothetical protein